MQEPTNLHLTTVKSVLKYLKGTQNLVIQFTRTTQVSLSGYSDSDWAGNIDDIRSTSGYVFTLGIGPFSWSFHKQTLVAQSSAEAEYITASVASNLAIWLRKVLANLKLSQCHSTPLLVDNKSAIAI